MKSFGLMSAAAGAVVLALASAATAAPIATSLPNLTTLAASKGSVQQVQYGYRHHRRCHRVWHHGRWHVRCHHH